MSHPASYLLLCSSVFWIAYAQHDTATDSPTTDCAAGFRYLHTGETVNISASCMNGECIAKCCPENQIMMKLYNDTVCVNSSTLKRNFSLTDPDNYSKAHVNIFGKDVKQKISKTKKKLTDFNFIFSEECDFAIDFLELMPEPTNLFYLTEDGRLHWRRVNFWDQWSSLPPGEFCVELQVEQDERGQLVSTEPRVVYMGVIDTGDNTSNDNDRAKLSVYGMLVSCFFLLLVLLAYALLKELRNLAGMILMAYVATLTAAFFARAVLVLANDNYMLDTIGCSVVGIIFLYLMLASFTWMNVMSFDIWWSMRGFRKLRQIHRRGILVKFGWYCLYAWGAPLLHILFIITEEHMDLTQFPNFVKSHIVVDPDRCFFNDSERQLYLNVPILITTFANVVFFIMTAYNIWRIKTAVTHHSARDSKKNDKEQFRFWIYLKLSVVMGFSWILEVASSLVYPESSVWYITDAYNVLIGIFIFAVFVCKRKIYVLLCRRLSIQNEYVGRWQRPTDSSTRASKKKMAGSVTESSDCGELYHPRVRYN